MYTCIKLFYDHPLTQCYLLEFYRNFKLSLTTPKMSETETKATSTSYQASTLPETQLAKIQASASAKTCQEETDTILIFHINLIVSKALVQHCTVLYPIANINLKQLDVLHVLAPCIKMGKGGMHNPISCNCAINPCYNFYRNLQHIIFS